MNEWMSEEFVYNKVCHHGNIVMNLVLALHPLFSIKFTCIILTSHWRKCHCILTKNIFFFWKWNTNACLGWRILLKKVDVCRLGYFFKKPYITAYFTIKFFKKEFKFRLAVDRIQLFPPPPKLVWKCNQTRVPHKFFVSHDCK